MTKIEWTDETWNPITGCTVKSDGCKNCYAMTLAGTRLKNHPSRSGLTRQNADGKHIWTGEVRFNEGWLMQPLRWKTPRMIFVCAHGDLFHENVPDEWIDKIFAVMALCPQHIFQVLTKRSVRMREYLTGRWHFMGYDMSVSTRIASTGSDIALSKRFKISHHLQGWPMPNVWLGVSVEDQATANERIPDLLATPAAVRWLSCEPLLGKVDLQSWLEWPDGGCELPDGTPFGCYGCDPEGPSCVCPQDKAYYNVTEGPRDAMGCPEWVGADRITLDWIVVGGESGPNSRPMHPDWARSIRDQCGAGEVPFFFKQWGSWGPMLNAAMADSASSDTAWPDGSIGGGSQAQNGGLGITLSNATKKIHGRHLDGRTHDAFPRSAA